MRHLRHTDTNSHFTLVEIMIVVAIIGLLAAIAIPNFIRERDKTGTANYAVLKKYSDDSVLECNSGIVGRIITNCSNGTFVRVYSKTYRGTNVTGSVFHDMWTFDSNVTNGTRVAIRRFEYDEKMFPEDNVYSSRSFTTLAVPVN